MYWVCVYDASGQTVKWSEIKQWNLVWMLQCACTLKLIRYTSCV